MGRSTLLTDELRADVERELAAGVPVAVAAQRVGVGRRTLTRWLARGDVVRRRLASAPEPVADIVSLDDRLAPAEPGLVAVIFAAAQRGSWTAAAWVLERRWPERCSRPPQRQPVQTEPEGDDPFAFLDEVRAAGIRKRQRRI
jgi:transposase